MIVKNIQARYIHCVFLAALIIFTVVLAINNYNSGVYADTHYLDGASVGWFHPNGVLMFVLTATLTILYSVYFVKRFKNRQ